MAGNPLATILARNRQAKLADRVAVFGKYREMGKADEPPGIPGAFGDVAVEVKVLGVKMVFLVHVTDDRPMPTA